MRCRTIAVEIIYMSIYGLTAAGEIIGNNDTEMPQILKILLLNRQFLKTFPSI